MRLPALFGKDRSPVVAPETQDRAEKLLAETFRLLGQVCGKMANLIETQRLERAGYEKQERYLERLDANAKSAKPETK